MEVKFLLLLVFASRIFGQALLSVLETHQELSTLNSYINASTTLSKLISSANNFTLLAPSNTAFEEWLSAQNPPLSDDVIEATLTYHLLHGGFPTASFSTEPQFAATALTNATYANVTGGQRVELVTGSNGKAQFLSGNNSVATIASADLLATGGIIQIINSVLTVPLNIVLAIIAANLNFFIAILNQGGYLTVQDASLISKIENISNVTFFAPNTASALAVFSAKAPGLSQAELAEIFNYHIVSGVTAYSSQLENGMELQTVQGSNLTVTRRGTDIYINSAKVLAVDLLVANGVLHVVDSLLDRFNTSAPSSQPTASPTAAPAKHSHNSTSKIAIGVSVTLAVVFLATFTFFFIRFLRQRRTSERQGGDAEGGSFMGVFRRRKNAQIQSGDAGGSPITRFLKQRTMSRRRTGRTTSYIRQVEPRGKANQVLGQDFELDATQVVGYKRFEASIVELDGTGVRRSTC